MSAQQFGHANREIGERVGRDRFVTTPGERLCISAVLWLSEHIDGVGIEVHDPDLRDGTSSIDRQLDASVKPQATFCELDQQKYLFGLRMCRSVEAFTRPDQDHVRLE